MILYLCHEGEILQWCDEAVLELEPLFEPFTCNYYGEPCAVDIYVGF